MKKISLTFAFAFFCICSQSQAQWLTNGNSFVTSSDFLGTTNGVGLKIKTTNGGDILLKTSTFGGDVVIQTNGSVNNSLLAHQNGFVDINRLVIPLSPLSSSGSPIDITTTQQRPWITFNTTTNKSWVFHNPNGQDGFALIHTDGTNPPTFPFSVGDNGQVSIGGVSNDVPLVIHPGNAWGSWASFKTNNNSKWEFHNPPGQNEFILLNQVGTQPPTFPFSISENGKVRIGDVVTTSNDYKLFVEKGIVTERIKVAIKTTPSWPDYVFKENYELMPISEVEDYIHKYYHLPNVPSASQVVEEGLDLAQMDAKLLEKIEELTLYMIELKKDNELLKSKIKLMESNK